MKKEPQYIIQSSKLSSQLENNTQFMQQIIESTPGLIVVYNINSGKYLYINNAVEKILGYSKENFLHDGYPFVVSLIHPDDIQELLEENNHAIKKANNPQFAKQIDKAIINFEYRMRHKDGTYRWLHTDGIILDRSPDGKVEHVMNISIDITERKKAEEELTKKNLLITRANKKLKHTEEKLKKAAKELEQKVHQRAKEVIFQEKRFRALIENNADAIALVSSEGNFLYVTPSVKKILGFTPEELIGTKVRDLFPPEYKDVILKKFSKAQKVSGTTLSVDHTCFHKNGSIRWVESTITNLLQDKTIRAYISNFRDITQRKQIDERQAFLEKISKKLITTINHTITLHEIAKLLVPFLADYCRIAIIDEEKQIKEIVVNHDDPEKIHLTEDLYTNYIDEPDSTHGVRRILQTGKAEIISHVNENVLETVKNNKKLLSIIKDIGLKSYIGVPLIVRDKVIGAMTLSSAQNGRYYTKNDLSFTEEIARRISLTLENRRLYKEAVQEAESRKKAEDHKDLFISMASHELKTPLTSTKLFIEILQKHLSRTSDEKALQFLGKIRNQADKLQDLVNDLLDVSRIQTGKLSLQKEQFTIDELVTETVEQLQLASRNHTIVIANVQKSRVHADRFRIYQVLTNLIINAMKYSPHGKKIILNIIADETHAVVSIQDFGIGIAKDQHDKIFERLYQVSDPKEKTFPGLGMGLYISNEIVTRHGGKIWLQSDPGKGSIFYFSLPLHKEAGSS